VQNRLYSAGLDGLMCAFEYVDGKFSEDDALLNGKTYRILNMIVFSCHISIVYNVEQPINKLGFFGPSNEFLYGVTSTEMLSFWNLTDVRILIRRNIICDPGVYML
jgi:hypothetical protein